MKNKMLWKKINDCFKRNSDQICEIKINNININQFAVESVVELSSQLILWVRRRLKFKLIFFCMTFYKRMFLVKMERILAKIKYTTQFWWFEVWVQLWNWPILTPLGNFFQWTKFKIFYQELIFIRFLTTLYFKTFF